MATQTTQRISELILESELLTASELDEARKLHRAHGGNLCNVLVAHGYLNENELLTWLANLPGMASIDIAHYAIDPALCDYVTASYAAAHEVMPLAKAAALEALELDGTLAAGHRSLALVLAFYDRDWDEAEA